MRRVDAVKVILVDQCLKLGQQAALVFHKCFVVVPVGQCVHPRLPIVESPGVQHAGDQVREIGVQIKHGVWHQGKAKDIADPVWIDTAHQGPRNNGIDVPICEHNKAGPQGRKDDLFQTVDHVGCIIQIGCEVAQCVPAHGFFDSAAGQS